jgi:hypothetical protein
MTGADLRKIALSLDEVADYYHAGLTGFRAGGRKFASPASNGVQTANR